MKKKEIFGKYIDGTLDAEEFAIELGEKHHQEHFKGPATCIVTNAEVAKLFNKSKK